MECDGDVLDDLALGRDDLAYADHRVDELSHGRCRVLRGGFRGGGEMVQEKGAKKTAGGLTRPATGAGSVGGYLRFDSCTRSAVSAASTAKGAGSAEENT